MVNLLETYQREAALLSEEMFAKKSKPVVYAADSKSESKKHETISPAPEHHPQFISATISQKLNGNIKSKSEKTNLQDYDRKKVFNRFKEFCKQEGYDDSSVVFEKTSATFKPIKKFPKISKSPNAALWPIKESIFADNDLGTQLCKPIIWHDSPTRKPDKLPNKHIIKENARISAEQGRKSASKAISFIVNDSKRSNTSKRKRVLLPPLERTSLHTFTATWNPDASVPASKVT